MAYRGASHYPYENTHSPATPSTATMVASPTQGMEEVRGLKRGREDVGGKGVGQPMSTEVDDGFIADGDAGESGGEDDEEEGVKTSDKKAGRRKIKIEFIQDKSRRHITFSKRKAGMWIFYFIYFMLFIS